MSAGGSGGLTPQNYSKEWPTKERGALGALQFGAGNQWHKDRAQGPNIPKRKSQRSFWNARLTATKQLRNGIKSTSAQFKGGVLRWPTILNCHKRSQLKRRFLTLHGLIRSLERLLLRLIFLSVPLKPLTPRTLTRFIPLLAP